MNILVTGSSGWLGQTLVPRLARDGHKVVGLDPDAGPDHGDRGLGGRPRAGSSDHPRARHRGHRACRGAPQAAYRDPRQFGVRGGERAGHAQPPGGGGGAGLEGRPLRLHLDHLADDLAEDPRRQSGRRQGGDVDRRDPLAARAAQHLRRHQARRRGAVPAVQPSAQAADPDPAHVALLPRGRRHGARHRPVGREHQGQRVPVPQAHGRGCRRSPCRGAGQGQGARLRHLHHLGDDAVLAGRLPRADGRRAVGGGALFPGLSREICQGAAGRCSTSIDRVYDAGKARRKLGFVCRTGFREVLDGLASLRLSSYPAPSAS